MADERSTNVNNASAAKNNLSLENSKSGLSGRLALNQAFSVQNGNFDLIS
jgi:hypothetical protein